MKIIEPSVELIDDIQPEKILAKLERCGKVSHQSELGDAENFVRKIIKLGHESVLEHVSLTFRIICDRAIQNELVRHRHASFTVESTRYVKYNELKFVNPPDTVNARAFELLYRGLVDTDKFPPEIARAVLPLCLATELYMTANLRELRHILKLRTAKAAHPQMRQVAGQILNILREKLPVVVEDVGNETPQSCRGCLGSGVIDCTGTEIFEGDIVTVDGKRHVVEFRDGNFYVGNSYLLSQFSLDSSGLEVVGHIAED